MVVYLQGNPATNHGTHWVGGPDFLIEIAFPNDRCRDKLSFYASINTHEVLIVDRDQWQLELYRLQGGAIVLVGTSDLTGQANLVSSVMPVSFRLIPGVSRPQIEVTQTATGQAWAV